jgi:hypothetical protein
MACAGEPPKVRVLKQVLPHMEHVVKPTIKRKDGILRIMREDAEPSLEVGP